MDDTQRQAIQEAYPMPEDVRNAAASANANLYHGPDVGDWGGLSIFADWIDDQPTRYYCPDWGGLTDNEPEPETYWIGADGEHYDTEPDDLDNAEDENGEPWYTEHTAEPEPYYEIGPAQVAEAYGYATLYSYA